MYDAYLSNIYLLGMVEIRGQIPVLCHLQAKKVEVLLNTCPEKFASAILIPHNSFQGIVCIFNKVQRNSNNTYWISNNSFLETHNCFICESTQQSHSHRLKLQPVKHGGNLLKKYSANGIPIQKPLFFQNYKPFLNLHEHALQLQQETYTHGNFGSSE